jgi:16S rRNA (guanine527-N7)-methyltransferase
MEIFMLPPIEKVTAEFNECRLNMNEELYRKLDIYAEILVQFNKVMNLTSIIEPQEILTKHFLDSILICNMIEFPEKAKVIDVGTGAGFPLIPIKLYNPDLKITLIDSQAKRTRFLEELIGKLEIDAEIINKRAEEVSRDTNYREKFDVCVSRAVAPFPTLCEFCIPFVKTDGIFAAMKGPKENASDFASSYETLGGKYYGQIDYNLPNGDERRLILIKKISQTSTKYPRNSAQIIRNPL